MQSVERHRTKKDSIIKKVLGLGKISKYAVCIATLVLIVTMLMIRIAYLERGYFAIGGECLIPAIAVFMYLADREARNDD